MTISAYLHAQLQRYLADLEQLVAIDSGTCDKEGCNRVNDWLAARLAPMKFAIERFPQTETGDHLLARAGWIMDPTNTSPRRCIAPAKSKP